MGVFFCFLPKVSGSLWYGVLKIICSLVPPLFLGGSEVAVGFSRPVKSEDDDTRPQNMGKGKQEAR